MEGKSKYNRGSKKLNGNQNETDALTSGGGVASDAEKLAKPV